MAEGAGSNLDEVWRILGPFGKYTVVNYAFLLFPCYLAGIYGSVFNFEAMDINYRCAIPECEYENSTWIEYAIPKQNNKFDKCRRYDYFNESNTCDQLSFNRSSIFKCKEYVYSNEDSVVKDFNLGCQDWKRTLIGTMYCAGFLIALPLTGVLSDKYGRVKSMAVASAMYAIFGTLRSFSTSYEMLIIFEFLETATGAATYSTAFVFGMELVRPDGRVFGNTLMNFAFILGSMSLSLLAWVLQNWRLMLRIVYAPAFLVLSYLFILNESPRWLLSKGRCEEALSILKKAENMNKVTIPEHLLASLKATAKYDESSINEMKFGTVFTKVVKSRTMLLRLVLCCYLWITCSFAYYGLSINSVSLAGNKYLNYTFVAFIEIPANVFCYVVLTKYGRKRVLVTMYALGGIFCIGLTLIARDSLWSLFIYLAGKFAITVAYSTVYVTASEIFPTNARQSLLAICSTTGRAGATMAPLSPLLALYNDNLPTIIFGSLALLASLLSLTIPETDHVTLPDSVKEAKKIAQIKKISKL
ncbi:unnamed protein product [Pieris macdunnoughi]|uniref:Major facilitator superfamily (MFS) profile domain-containing protein n=1 Tax=Pieris macdunnoughi TaxID=345717 RepID=A0A821YBE1_9NEOP|nr:unnamed protein product [Pieris macdunnoughi]